MRKRGRTRVGEQNKGVGAEQGRGQNKEQRQNKEQGVTETWEMQKPRGSGAANEADAKQDKAPFQKARRGRGQELEDTGLKQVGRWQGY